MCLCLQQQLEFTLIFIIDNFPRITQQQMQLPKAFHDQIPMNYRYINKVGVILHIS